MHSCLSPCADNGMTPANIAGFAKLNGIDLLAVTDHNCALNLPAVKKACDAYGVRLLPGLEMTTEEEIHLLCYFPTVQAALQMSGAIRGSLPDFPYDRSIWGEQLVMDENDVALGEIDVLLAGAASIDLYGAKTLCEGFGGIAVPAHVDKDSTSLLSVLGFAPQDLPFEAYEIKRPEHSLAALTESGRLPRGQELLTSSDAHSLADIAQYPRTLGKNSCLLRLLNRML